MSNNITINIGAIKNMHIRFFFKLHAENKTAQTISHNNKEKCWIQN